MVEWFAKHDKQKDNYEAAIATLVEMVERHMAGKRFIVIRKPKIDVERWVRRQMRVQEAQETERDLTASLLGTNSFVRIA